MPNKKLSIITICYNEPNLEETCESIVNQTWQEFEWVVVDGGSNKETLDIFDKYKYRIDKFISEPDKGIYDAYNKGLKLVSGECINFMNAGDSFYNNNVLKSVFENNMFNEDILYGDACLCYRNNSTLNSIKKYPKSIDKLFFINNNLCTQSMFIKFDLFNKYEDFNTEYKIAADFECWVKFIKNNVGFEHIELIVANYDMHGISTESLYENVHQNERNSIINNYYTKAEINKATDKLEYTFLEQIFSIKNSFNKKHRVITIWGIHIKWRKK